MAQTETERYAEALTDIFVAWAASYVALEHLEEFHQWLIAHPSLWSMFTSVPDPDALAEEIEVFLVIAMERAARHYR